MAEAWWVTANVRDALAAIPDGSIDLVLTSPPFLALRSYLPADHPDKGREIGSEATPAEFLSTLLALTDEFARVLAPHGSIAVELGDTYSGSGGAGGDYGDGGLRDGQERFNGAAAKARAHAQKERTRNPGPAWPLAKSLTFIPQLYGASLAYGRNLLTGEPCRQWRVRNYAPWVRNNPPVGALGDKWRPGSSYMTVACLRGDRWWDELGFRDADVVGQNLLDWVHCDGSGYPGAHYAVWPAELLVRPVKAMCPMRVCTVCGKPSERIVETERTTDGNFGRGHTQARSDSAGKTFASNGDTTRTTLGWSDCGHSAWRNGRVLDPFAGSGTTASVATGYGRDSINIDLDARNADLAYQRVGGLVLRDISVDELAGLLEPTAEEGVA